MFREVGPGLGSFHDGLSCDSPIKSNTCHEWKTLEGDPLGREKLEFRLSHMIQLLLRSEGGDAHAREELKAIV